MGELQRIRVGDWAVSPAQNLLQRDGQSVRLEPRVMDLLVYLADHSGEVVSTDELISSVWQGRVVGEGTVYQRINQLRQALGDSTQEARFIETIPKRGYRLVVSVSAMDPAPSEEVSARAVGQLRRRKIGFALAGVLVLTLAVLGVRYIGEEGRGVLPNSIAVLPFENLSPNPDDSYFAVGIHEAVLNELAKISAMNVIARTSTLPYADRTTPIAEIARELGVETVMEGSVQYAEGRVRITVQLIDPVTRAHLWSEDYDRDFVDIFAIQSDIAINIANALEAEFSLEVQASIEKIPTDSPEAYALYLKALGSPLNEVMATYLDQAIELDPDFALAHAMKAYNYTFALIGVGGGNPDQVAALESIVRDSAERALALDSSLGLAHAALADVHMVNWRAAEAEQAFQLAYQLSPDADVLMSYGRFKRYKGEYAAAIPLLRRAVELDPNNRIRYNQLGIAYTRTRAYDAAAIALGTAVELRPTDVGSLTNLALTEVARGNYDDAVRHIEIVERLNPDTGRFAQMALAYSQMGRDEDALRMFLKFEESAAENPVGDAWWARAYLAVGDYEQALQRLETAVEERELTDLASLAGLAANPWGDPILDEPDFQELLDGLWDNE